MKGLPGLGLITAEQVLAYWGEGLAAAEPQDLLLSWSVPRINAELLVQTEEFSCFWAQGQATHVGIGRAREFFLDAAYPAPQAFERARRWAAPLSGARTWSGLAEHVRPRAFGGFAFQPERPRLGNWQAFGAARFVVPRLSYSLLAGQASLSLFLRAEEKSEVKHWLARARAFADSLASLQKINAISVPNQPPLSEKAVRTDADDWSDKVNDILAGIARGAFSKVVAARRVELEFEAAISVAGTLAALGSIPSDGTLFAFCFGQVTFLGATPERLILKQGRQVMSDALAGTFRREAEQFGAELLRSPKEHSEHAPVLKAVVEKLQAHCETIEYSTQPELQTLPHLLHLRTPIAGRLKANSSLHVLELAELLHPTPAVGGVPTDAALAWIQAHEGFDRGWYAGPVGWFDSHGDGEFVVGLRSGLVAGKRIQLFAGCGIVADSKPSNEFMETELKFRRLGTSLKLQG